MKLNIKNFYLSLVKPHKVFFNAEIAKIAETIVLKYNKFVRAFASSASFVAKPGFRLALKFLLFTKLSSLVILFFAFQTARAGLPDRAFATHNVGNIGFFTTNIGQFYPYGGQLEKTLEYPINSGQICMYRQCLIIGAKMPNGDYNVISAADGRFEEFDAIGGFDAGNAEIAMSDKPQTWPGYGWPVKDNDGNPLILSQQESYCVYSDSTNWRYAKNNEDEMLMNLRIHQTIYSWGVPDADRFVILKFDLENYGDDDLSEVYFNMYSDLDIGGISSGDEWADDCVGFDKNRELVWFYDSDNYSDEWLKDNPFLTGITFLNTPNDKGITDFHWVDVTIDEVAVNSTFWDSLGYSLMASDTNYFYDHPDLKVEDYFHLGDNPIDSTHFDDPVTSQITDTGGNLIGGPMVAWICNGPFDLAAGETKEIWVGIGVGDDETDLMTVIDQMREYYANYEETGDFGIKVMPTPELEAIAGDQSVDLFWSNDLDINYENPANNSQNDLEGYILYKTTDPNLNEWDIVETIPLEYDVESDFIERAYQVKDENGVYNGFTTFYNLCAYRTSITGSIEQSLILSNIENMNNQSNAVGVQPVSQSASDKNDMNRIKAVPNPYVVSAQWDRARLGNTVFGEPIRNLAFTHLPSPCTIKIFTIDGDLVNTLEHNGTNGRYEWNLLTSERRPVVSGIYFYHVNSKVGEKVGRFAVIR